MLLERLRVWTLAELPRLNQAILAGHEPPSALVDTLTDSVLARLPAPEALTVREAQQLLVQLGLSGVSVARHHQERTAAGHPPERAFDRLRVGPDRLAFLPYVAAVAARTGTGHPARDGYASLVRWNVGTREVWLGRNRVAVLPGVFDDGRVRTYTGAAGEERFFVLVKESETLELAVNRMLEPIWAGETGLLTVAALRRVQAATAFLRVLIRLNRDFVGLPRGNRLEPDHFTDVFRQFAVHWTPGDLPPSGALDPEALERDLLLGLDLPGQEARVRRLLPGLLDSERARLSRLAGSPALPDRLLDELGLDRAALATMSDATLWRTLGLCPALWVWYRLLDTHARASAVHLMLAKRYLFNQARGRAAAGLPDHRLVSDFAGTTGMTESLLERIVRARRNHVLSPLRRMAAAANGRRRGAAGPAPDDPAGVLTGADWAAADWAAADWAAADCAAADCATADCATEDCAAEDCAAERAPDDPAADGPTPDGPGRGGPNSGGPSCGGHSGGGPGCGDPGCGGHGRRGPRWGGPGPRGPTAAGGCGGRDPSAAEEEMVRVIRVVAPESGRTRHPARDQLPVRLARGCRARSAGTLTCGGADRGCTHHRR